MKVVVSVVVVASRASHRVGRWEELLLLLLLQHSLKSVCIIIPVYSHNAIFNAELHVYM